jgi:hypothetical protein
VNVLAYLRLVLALAFVGVLGYAGLWIVDALLPTPGQASTRAGGTARRLAYAFALGMGVTAAGMLLWSWLHIRLSLLAMIVLGVFPVCVYLVRRKLGRGGTPAGALAAGPEHLGSEPAGPNFECRDLLPRKLVLALLGAAVAVVVLTCFLEPIVEVDPTAGWALHAKVFYYERTALPPFLTCGAAGPYVSHWPPVVPLVQTWGHIAMGAYDDHKIKLVFAVAFAALLALVYGTLREHLRSSPALVMVFILATVPAIAVHFPAGSVASAHADVPFALFLTGAAVSLMAWAETRQTRAVALAGLLAALAIWVKVEGLAFAAVSSFCVWLFWAVGWVRNRAQGRAGSRIANPTVSRAGTLSHPLLYSALVLVSLVLYALYKAQFRAPIAGEAFDPGRALAPETVIAGLKIAAFTCLEAVNPGRWGFIWILLAILVVLRSKHLARPMILMPLLLVVGQVACAVVVMAASGLSPEYWAFHTVRRVLIHVAPIAVILVGLLASVPNGEARSESQQAGTVRAG